MTNITPSPISEQSTSLSPPEKLRNQPPRPAPRPPPEHSSTLKHKDQHTYFYPERQDKKGPKKFFQQVCYMYLALLMSYKNDFNFECDQTSTPPFQFLELE